MGLHFLHICRMQDKGQIYGCVHTVQHYHVLYIYVCIYIDQGGQFCLILQGYCFMITSILMKCEEQHKVFVTVNNALPKSLHAIMMLTFCKLTFWKKGPMQNSPICVAQSLFYLRLYNFILDHSTNLEYFNCVCL